MSWDGDRHHFLPAPAVGHAPEHPYIGLFEALETVYAYSQESARIVLVKAFADTRQRSLDLLDATTLNDADYKTLFHQADVIVPDPCDTLTAILAFRANFGAPTRVRLRLTVGATTATATDFVTVDESGRPMAMAGDRDVLSQQVIASELDVAAVNVSSVVLKVEVSAYGPILPEWLMIVRSA